MREPRGCTPPPLRPRREAPGAPLNESFDRAALPLDGEPPGKLASFEKASGGSITQTWQSGKVDSTFSSLFLRDLLACSTTHGRRGRLAAARCALRGTVVMALVDVDPKMHEDDDDKVRCRARSPLLCNPMVGIAALCFKKHRRSTGANLGRLARHSLATTSRRRRCLGT